MHEREDERAGNDAAHQDDERAQPRPVQHAGRYLHDLARDERHHDLQELKPQQDEEAHRPCAAHVGDDAVDAARLEDVGHIRPDEQADNHHNGEECDQADELEDVALLHLVAVHGRLLLRLLVQLVRAFGRLLLQFAGIEFMRWFLRQWYA